MDLSTRIQNSFDRQAMMATFDASLIEVRAGAVSISAPILALATQQHGVGHGGLVVSLGDSAAGYSALTLLEPEQEVMTSELKINFLAPARGDRLVARGRVIKPGRRLIVCQADVYAQTGGAERHIALLSATMVPVNPDR